MHIILDHHLKAEAQVPEYAGDQQDQGERDGRVRRPAQHRAMVGQRQAYERDDEPGDEQQVAERGEALLQPVAGAVIGRADTAHAAEGRSVTPGAPPARYRARSRRSRGSRRRSRLSTQAGGDRTSLGEGKGGSVSWNTGG